MQARHRVSVNITPGHPNIPKVTNWFDHASKYYLAMEYVDELLDDLLELGRDGGYIFAPAHDVEGDVPLENMLAFIIIIQQQPGYVNELEERRQKPYVHTHQN
jgi:hypothetical protein